METSITKHRIPGITSSVRITIGVILLLVGCALYLTMRSQPTNLHIWLGNAGFGHMVEWLKMDLPSSYATSFLTYNLADILYCISYILIMDAIWHTSPRPVRAAFALAIPFAACVHEMLQFFHIMPGTFDPIDLAGYVIPSVVYLFLLKK